MQIEEALEKYCVQLHANGRSPHTIAQARRHVVLFDAWWKRELEDVGHEDVARFLISSSVQQRADGAPRKASSANALRSSLRAFFGYAHAAGLTPTNPARLVRRASCPPPPPRALCDADVEKLTAALATASTAEERRDRVLFTLLLRVGLRLGSALALNVEDIDIARRVLRLTCVKNGGEASAILPDDMVPILRDHIGSRTSGAMFRAAHGGRVGARHVRRRLAELAERAGVGHVHPHQLRHTVGARIYRKTNDLLVTGRVLNHRSVASTAIYARADETAVRRAMA